MYCRYCGRHMSPNAVACPGCGEPTDLAYTPMRGRKSRVIALVLCLFLGLWGVHRMYVGKVGSGILQLCTAGGLVVWTLIDLVSIICDNFTDADGNLLS